MKTLGLISLGCPKNLVDSEVMLGLLEQAGYKIVQNPAEAEVLIVNTCAFIEDAKKESIDAILEMSGYKADFCHSERSASVAKNLQRKSENGRSFGRSTSSRPQDDKPRGKCKKLVVTGCLPQRYKDKLAKLLPEVDLFVGTGEYQKIVELLCHPERPAGVKDLHNKVVRGRSFGLRPQDDKAQQVINTPQYIHNSATPRKLATPKHAVYLKIAEGCFHGCSFCIIPKLRGKFRSRPMDDIVAEAKMLIAGGAKELNLIAQDTTSYGRDLKDGSNLAQLIRKLNRLDGDFWIRIMYAYPTSITDEFITAVAESKKVCKYLDIPIQHISDRILSAMRRKEKGSDIRRLVKKLRIRMPDVTLRTSVIVGFPGETKKEFNELLNFVKEGHFNHLGVFAYSREEGTKAAKLGRQVPQKTKEKRCDAIMKAQAKVVQRRNKHFIGKAVKVLVDVGEPLPYIIARTEGQAPEIDGITYIKMQDKVFKVGEFTLARIIDADEYDLYSSVSS